MRNGYGDAQTAERTFPRRVFPGDVADYEDGKVTMWDEEQQVEEEQVAMLFKMLM